MDQREIKDIVGKYGLGQLKYRGNSFVQLYHEENLRALVQTFQRDASGICDIKSSEIKLSLYFYIQEVYQWWQNLPR